MPIEKLIAQLKYDALYIRYKDPLLSIEVLNQELKVDGVARIAFQQASEILNKNGIENRFSVLITAPHDLSSSIASSEKTQGVEFLLAPSEPSVTYSLQYAPRSRRLTDTSKYSSIELTSARDGLSLSLYNKSANRYGGSDGGHSNIKSIKGWEEKPYSVIDEVCAMVNLRILYSDAVTS